jgi:hypothetical protein
MCVALWIVAYGICWAIKQCMRYFDCEVAKAKDWTAIKTKEIETWLERETLRTTARLVRELWNPAPSWTYAEQRKLTIYCRAGGPGFR